MKSGFEFAIRKYWWRKIYQPMLIDYEHWALVNLVETKDVVGESLTNIHKKYWEHKLKKG
jgi:hypothetical protein